MRKIAVATLLAMTFASACSSPPEAPKATSAPPKATTPPAPPSQAAPSQAAPSQAAPSQAAPSVGKIYGDTLKGGIDKAKEIQETEKNRIQQMDNAAGQNQANPGE